MTKEINKEPDKEPVNWMNRIAGKWPGNETDEEFEELLKEI